jgi:hypothetical protein
MAWRAAGRGDIPKAMRTLDAAHLALMLLALTLAYVVPFELLLFAYVVLGPAHYATEISWLHDRKYFVPHHAVALTLAAVAILVAFIDSASWFGFIIWSTLVVCALIVTAKSGVQVMLLLAGAAALTLVMYLNAPWLGVVGILLPTLIHVSLFTLVFMALGALRSRSAFQGALIAVYIAALLLIVLAPPSADRYPDICDGGEDLFRQRRAGAKPRLSRPRHDARRAADRPVSFCLHLSLPQLVHQSRGHPVDQHPARSARTGRRRQRGIDRTLFLRLHHRLRRVAGVQPASRRARIPAQCACRAPTRRRAVGGGAAETSAPRRRGAASAVMRERMAQTLSI